MITNHHPLISILNNHPLDEINKPCLQRLKTRVMAYNFSAEWVKGVLNSAPDALSRNPVSDLQPQEMLAEWDTSNNPEITVAEIRALSPENIRLQSLHKHAELYHEYEQLRLLAWDQVTQSLLLTSTGDINVPVLIAP